MLLLEEVVEVLLHIKSEAEGLYMLRRGMERGGSG